MAVRGLISANSILPLHGRLAPLDSASSTRLRHHVRMQIWRTDLPGHDKVVIVNEKLGRTKQVCSACQLRLTDLTQEKKDNLKGNHG